MNEISIFDFSDNPIRTIAFDDKPYFVARDICLALGYSKPENAVKQHCRATLKQGIIDSLGREQATTIIPESDLYRLIFNSKLPAAQKFEEWVTNDVLPTLRKTGEYNLKPEEEIDDICLEYDTGNIQVAEFELRAIKVICQLFGRDAAKQAYMSSKYLPKPTYAIDGRKDVSAISCLEHFKTLFVSNYPICKLISNKCTDILKGSGFDIVDDMLCVATSSKAVAQHFADSRWANNWVATLLELPHAERGRAAKRFAGITAKYIMVPTFYFREPINVRN